MVDTGINSDLKLNELNDDCLIKICNYLSFLELMYLKKSHNVFDHAIEAACKVKGFIFKLAIPQKGVSNLIKLCEEFLLLYGDKIQKSTIDIRSTVSTMTMRK